MIARSTRLFVRRCTVVSSFVLLACGQSPGLRRAEPTAALGPGVAAQVGSSVIDVEAVQAVARDAKVSPELARGRLIRDALYAAGARDRVGGAELVSAERAVLARALLEEIRRAVSASAPTDSEIDELSREHWKKYDCPPSVVTAHVVVRVRAPAEDRPARALAERLATALRDVTDPDRFLTQARAVPTEGLDVVAQRLPAVASDGRVTAEDADAAQFDRDFARAANAIARPGEKSPVVKSAFGYHVILLIERIPERRVEMEQRRRDLREEAAARRAKRELAQLLESLRRQSPPDVDRAAVDLTSRVRVSR